MGFDLTGKGVCANTAWTWAFWVPIQTETHGGSGAKFLLAHFGKQQGPFGVMRERLPKYLFRWVSAQKDPPGVGKLGGAPGV